jgi:tetratricopeptide (TPR) repeat protein
MKIPQDINGFTISNDTHGLFPPLGYLTIDKTSDGGGDDLGLYWEIGKENDLPIVCSLRHEESLLVAEFKDFKSFKDWFEETGGQESSAMNLNDNDFFISLTNKGKVLTKNGKSEEAIQKLEKAVSLFGEFSETWYWLAENYYKTGQKDKADKALLNSIMSNYFFGLPSQKCIDKFNEMTPSEELKEHPVIKRKTDLIQGGDFKTPFSMSYALVGEIVEELKEGKDYRTALLMQQNYGLLMASESEEVIGRHSFNIDTWYEGFRNEIFSIYPGRKY